MLPAAGHARYLKLVQYLQVVGKDLLRSLLDTANIRARKIHQEVAGADQAVEIV
jgi:hypothetical protein